MPSNGVFPTRLTIGRPRFDSRTLHCESVLIWIKGLAKYQPMLTLIRVCPEWIEGRTGGWSVKPLPMSVHRFRAWGSEIVSTIELFFGYVAVVLWFMFCWGWGMPWGWCQNLWVHCVPLWKSAVISFSSVQCFLDTSRGLWPLHKFKWSLPCSDQMSQITF